MKVRSLVEELQQLDQDKEIGILYTDNEDNSFFPSMVICISKQDDIKDKIKWKNGGYCLY